MADADPVEICRVCGCTDPNPCRVIDGTTGALTTCRWVTAMNDLCSECDNVADATPRPLLYDAGGTPIVFR